jgi:GNAT superfamily N-acetyltransferase
MHLPVRSDRKVNEAASNVADPQGCQDSSGGKDSERSRAVGPTSGPDFIRPFQAIDRQAFRNLNEAWISQHFALEPEDTELLSDPEGKILARGGHIFVAVIRQDGEEEVVGCFALLPLPGNVLRLARMTVREDHRGKGVGRRLLNHAIISAQALHARRLVLETSRKLESAVHLYQSAGFCFAPSTPAGSRPLARADLYMELLLPDG